MYETVRVVNGHEAKRMVGMKGPFWVLVKETARHNQKFKVFKTIKAAVAFCESL